MTSSDLLIGAAAGIFLGSMFCLWLAYRSAVHAFDSAMKKVFKDTYKNRR